MHGWGLTISVDQYALLHNIAKQLKLEHVADYDQEDDRSFLRISNGDMHMLFYANSYNVNKEAA